VINTGEMEEELSPPSPRRVAARALVLACVCGRGLIERHEGEEEMEKLQSLMLPWLDRLDIATELEDAERELLETPLGELFDQDKINAGWRSEGMVVLAWSLGKAALPGYQEECDPRAVADELGLLGERPETVLDAPRMRTPAEIEHWANTYLTLHWRLREFLLQRQPIDFEASVRRATWGPLTVAELRLIGGDLAIGDVRIDRAPEPAFRKVLSIAGERHHAFNWLLGFESIYSEISTDT
jgi:Domain of unknown function (DUF4272)